MNAIKILENIANNSASRASTLVEGQDTNIFSDPDSWWMINTSPWEGSAGSTNTDGCGANLVSAVVKALF